MLNFNKIKRFENHAHSMYSNIRLIDCINQPKDLIIKANELGLSGICLTDHECISGAVEWLGYEKELKEKSILPKDFKCAIGNEIYLIDSRENSKKYFHYILIAKDTIGFRQLCELSSNSWYNSYTDRGLERVPTLKSELAKVVNKNPGHLIVTSACLGGELSHLLFNYLDNRDKLGVDSIEAQIAKDNINNFITFNLDLFGDDFYIEVAPSLSKDQIRFNSNVKKILKDFNLKYIYGTDAHYLTKELRSVHKAYLNSKDGDREVDDFYEYAHLMDNDEAYGYLSKCFNDEEFIEFCRNSMEIYDKIGGYDIFHNPIIPHVDVYEYDKNESLKYETVREKIGAHTPVISKLFVSDSVQERYWVNQCFEGLIAHKLVKKKYLERLETEADIIDTVGNKLNNCLFEYFNTFQHFIELFWSCNSLNGPGRGSSVCFLSNYLLGITQLNPLQWGLAEWRFLNKDRLELPEIYWASKNW